MAEEQRIYDLKKMAEHASGRPILDKVDWMYSVKKGPSTEEYLQGTSMQQEEEKELELLSKNPGALWNRTINPQQDAAAKVRDDPLLMIKQQEQQSLKKFWTIPFK